MKLSKSGLKNIKLNNNEDMFAVQQILLDSGQLKQYASGVFGLGNILIKAKQNIENIIRDEFDKNDLVEIYLPTIQPKETWERSGRYEHYVSDGTMLVTETNHGTLCLAPTAEEAVIEFLENELSSYKQLPVIVYQIGEKYRNEIRNRGYLFRGKAFPMMDAYSFDKDFEGLKNSYNKVKKCYFNIFKKLELNAIPVVADNGSIGGKKSEEFMLISELGEDTILYNKNNNMGLNTEILEKENYEDILKNEYNISNISEFEKVKSIELGHIFQLGTVYTESMKSYYTSQDEKQLPFVMGCYGIGISRTLATICETNRIIKNDSVVGFSLPIHITPYLATIIATNSKKEEAEELYTSLQETGVSLILDDRYDKKNTFGQKLNNANILGAPYVVILGDKIEAGFVEVENIKTGKSFKLEISKFKELAQESFNKKIYLEELI